MTGETSWDHGDHNKHRMYSYSYSYSCKGVGDFERLFIIIDRWWDFRRKSHVWQSLTSSLVLLNTLCHLCHLMYTLWDDYWEVTWASSWSLAPAWTNGNSPSVRPCWSGSWRCGRSWIALWRPRRQRPWPSCVLTLPPCRNAWMRPGKGMEKGITTCFTTWFTMFPEFGQGNKRHQTHRGTWSIIRSNQK